MQWSEYKSCQDISFYFITTLIIYNIHSIFWWCGLYNKRNNVAILSVTILTFISFDYSKSLRSKLIFSSLTSSHNVDSSHAWK